MSIETKTFQSRWGFHPCDVELFLKLKKLHKWYWETVYGFHRWHRWWRKEEHNRPGPEPGYCPAFVEDRPWIKLMKFHGVDGYKVYPKTVIDHGILELYQSARTPRPEPVPAFEDEILSRIDSLYEKARVYFDT